MAFLRYAFARDAHIVTPKSWGEVRVASTEAPMQPNLVEQASEILHQKFDPDKFLLTHATIVASVDTYDVSGVKLGREKVGSFTVNRKYGDYRIKPESDPYINNNLDSWERKVLAKSYSTFVGGHNFLEHLQIEDQSKGRILDAVARDIGPSLYVDILIATDRKHRKLVADIEALRMTTLSMGCSIDFSVCTKCGNVAVDETEMCTCVRFEKGNVFYDEEGRRHRIAELCGHADVDPTGGVRFIEGSWVGVPAFEGAVLRTILTPQKVTPDQLKRAREILSNPPRVWTPQSLQGMAKAATLLASQKYAFDFGGDDEENAGGDAEASDEDKDKGGILSELENAAQKETIRRIKKKIQDEINPPPLPVDKTKETATDENINRQAAQLYTQGVYKGTLDTITKMASSDAELINGVAQVNKSFGIEVPVSVYRAALRVGSTTRYQSLKSYLRTCERAMGRIPTTSESRTLVRLGNLLARWSG